MATDQHPTPARFGDLLRRVRLAAGLTQEALAERASLSARGLSDLERGVRAAPREDTLLLLVDALGLAPAERAVFIAAAHASKGSARPRSPAARPAPSTTRPFPLAELPTTADPLIGREREQAAIAALLRAAGTPLVTLTGPGGVGKTRLAIQVATDGRRDFPGGVAFVPLAAIRDAALVLPTIAQALGVREASTHAPHEALAIALRGRRVLLVLDNCEQLLPAAPAIGGLLEACPDLVILATSREALHLRSEQRYLVAPLGFPKVRTGGAGDIPADTPAFQLFVRRARQVRADFTLTPETMRAIAMICQRLDGLPLAIELAAARVAVLPPPALLARLDRALPLLSGGAQDQPERLRTMREAIAWSYDLLAPAQQERFHQLAVFDGGFTLAAAEVVCLTDDPELGVFADLVKLVEANLVRAEETAAGESRFSLLETIREYAVEQLTASGQEDLVRERHAAWALAFAEATQPGLFGAQQQTRLRQLEAERPNIRGALRWYEQRGDAERALRLAGALVPFHWIAGHFPEAQDWLCRALAIPGDTPAATRAWATMGVGSMAWFRGDNATAKAWAEAALVMARDSGAILGIGMALLLLTEVALMEGNLAHAVALGEEAIAQLRAVDDPSWLAIALNDAGTAALLHGNVARGEEWSAEGLSLTRTAGNGWFTAIKLSDLGVVAQGQGDLDAAAKHYAESVQLFREQGDIWYIASPLAGLAAVAVARGHPETAAQLVGVVMSLRETSGTTAWATERERDAQTVMTAQVALGAERYARAIAAGRGLSLEEAAALVDAL